MSSEEDSSLARHDSQAENADKATSVNQQDRFYAAWASVGELIVLLLTCAAAKLIGRRIAMFAESGWLPGMGDTRFVAAITGRPESSIASVVGDNPRPKYQVGRQPFYKLADFALYDSSVTPPAEKPPNDAPVKRAGKKKS